MSSRYTRGDTFWFWLVVALFAMVVMYQVVGRVD